MKCRQKETVLIYCLKYFIDRPSFLPDAALIAADSESTMNSGNPLETTSRAKKENRL